MSYLSDLTQRRHQCTSWKCILSTVIHDLCQKCRSHSGTVAPCNRTDVDMLPSVELFAACLSLLILQQNIMLTLLSSSALVLTRPIHSVKRVQLSGTPTHPPVKMFNTIRNVWDRFFIPQEQNYGKLSRDYAEPLFQWLRLIIFTS
jgi:hypothetical protein